MKIDLRKLEIARARACMNTGDLARKSGLAVSTLVQLRARGGTVSTATVGKLARALGCDVLDIIVDEEVK